MIDSFFPNKESQFVTSDNIRKLRELILDEIKKSKEEIIALLDDEYLKKEFIQYKLDTLEHRLDIFEAENVDIEKLVSEEDS